METKITELGGKYSKSDEGLLQPYIVVDGKLYTGQNPYSSEPLADRIVEDLKKQQKPQA